MKWDVIAVVPEIFQGWMQASLLGRAQQAGAVTLRLHSLRDFASDRWRTIDDYPFGGGAGMVLKAEPFFRAVEHLREECQNLGCPPPWVILLTPQGRPFCQEKARELAQRPHEALLCGRYEGVDERVREHLVDEELSIGDYVLIGGEVAAMVVIEATVRFVPGVLGSEESPQEESFSQGLLEYPHYTRPARFRGWEVPAVLLSGHHERIRLWRRKESLRRTFLRRPDLFQRYRLQPEDRRLLTQVEELGG